MAKIKLIAHRGLTNGPNAELENKPSNIINSLSIGFDCEIDLWKVNDNLYLGHDRGQYLIDDSFLDQPGLWIHCKNLEALEYCRSRYDLNFFWHQNDDCVITSKRFIWTYPGKPLTEWSVQLMPEWDDPNLDNIDLNCHGVCSDYVLRINYNIKTNDRNSRFDNR